MRQFDLGLSKATRSHHFKVLREAGLTHTRVEGTHRHISLRRDDVEALPGLLDAVLAAAERESASPRPATALARPSPDRLVRHRHEDRALGLPVADVRLDRVGRAALLPGHRGRRAGRAAGERLEAPVAAAGQRHGLQPERRAALAPMKSASKQAVASPQWRTAPRLSV